MGEAILAVFVICVFIMVAISSYTDAIAKQNRLSFLKNKPATIRNLNVDVNAEESNESDSPLFEQAKKALVECGFSAKESKDMLIKSYKSSVTTVEEWVKNAIIEANKV